ncbi:MAG: M15 family metallopeptidase [Hyphomicrobiaceae bacterium]
MPQLWWFMAVGFAVPLVLPATAAAQQPTPVEQVARLVVAYPDFLDRAEGNALVWKDGTRMTIDDQKGTKDFAALLEKPDLKDMFYARYPVGAPAQAPAVNSDPGRVRYEPFFHKMYGDCRTGEVQAKLVDVVWLPRKWGKTLRISSINNVATRLAAVSRELDDLPARFDPFLKPAAGTFNCRPIAGTDRVSAHGHGIAIDIATAHAHYWRWSKPDATGRPAYRNEIPPEIVAVFEKHGFIWGGRWYHFDTMHFEYRPELLPP